MAFDDDPSTTSATTTTTTTSAVKKPRLNFDINDLMRDDEPVPNLIIVSTAEGRRNQLPPSTKPAAVEDSSSHLSQLEDPALIDKIKRLKNMIATMKLPDNGVKLKRDLKRYEEELQRRNDRKSQEVADGCKNQVQERRKSDGESDGPKRAAQSFGSLLMKKLGKDPNPESEQNGSVRVRNGFEAEMFLLNPCEKRKREAGGKLASGRKPRSGAGSKEFRSWKPSSDSRGRSKYGRLELSGPISQDKHPGSLTMKNGFKGLNSKSPPDDEEETTVVLVDEEEPELIEKIQEAEKRRSRRNDCKIYYPCREDPESLEIFRSELRCLEPGECLTSTIMNFYVRFLRELYSKSDRSKQKFYFFNTYFYNKLQDAVARQKSEKEAFFIKFRRWWKGVNIFEKTYIFLPINEDKHWSLVIVCISDEEDSGPVILHLDSLGLHDSSLIFDNIKSLLESEWKYLKEDGGAVDIPIPDPIKENLPERIDQKTIVAPRQTNDYDCGLFVLYYIERFIQDAPEKMKEEDLSKFGRKWFRAQEASSLRGKIRKILLEEFQKASRDDNSVYTPVCLPAVTRTAKAAQCVDMS